MQTDPPNRKNRVHAPKRQTAPPRQKGRFIVFEGIEACGKTTQIELLAERFRARGQDPLILREPGGTEIGEKIRSLLKDSSYLGQMSPEAELLLMNASRAQLVREVIRPALEKGRIVICDRYFYSTIAYQGFGRSLPWDALNAVNRFAVGGLDADFVIFLDIPLEESWERLCRRNEELFQTQGIQIKDRLRNPAGFFTSVFIRAFNPWRGVPRLLENQWRTIPRGSRRRNLEYFEMSISPINASTRYCGLFGCPVRHSASPAFQNAGIAAMGLNWRYLALEVLPENLPQAIEGAKAMGFVGLNLTVPHKEQAFRLADEVEDSARILGSVTR
jgi:dTMP kinase